MTLHAKVVVVVMMMMMNTRGGGGDDDDDEYSTVNLSRAEGQFFFYTSAFIL
jgi:hypothetical protein